MIRLELEFEGYDLTGDYNAMFASTGTIVAEGNNIDELYENASVDVLDSDGGEIAIVNIADLPNEVYDQALVDIETAYIEEIHKALNNMEITK